MLTGIVGDWVQINMNYARVLAKTTESSAIARIATSLTSQRVVGNGPSFNIVGDTKKSENKMRNLSATGMLDVGKNVSAKNRVSEGSDSISLNDMIGAVMDDWVRVAREIDREVTRQGFALVTRRESQYHPGIMVPHVVDIEYYDLYFRVSPLAGRQYIAVWQGLSMDQRKEVGANNRDPIKDAVVLVAEEYRPDHAGELRSKMASAAALISEVGGAEDNIWYSLYWSAHPVHATEMPSLSSGARSGTSDVGAPGYANYTDMLSDPTVVDMFRSAQQISTARNNAADAYSIHINNLAEAVSKHLHGLQYRPSHADAKARDARDCNARHAAHPPFLVNYPLSDGARMHAAPMPRIPTGIDEHKKDIIRRAMMTLDVQPGLVGLEHRNHASNADLVFDAQNDMIKQRQSILEPLLADAFRHVYGIDLHNTDVILAEQSTTHTAERLTGHSATPSIAHRVRASLTHTPMCSPDRALKLLETHAIDHQTYREMILQICSVSPHLAAQHHVSMDRVDAWFHSNKRTADERGAARKRRNDPHDSGSESDADSE